TEFIDAQLMGDRFSRAPIVARAHDDFQAHVVKFANRVSARRFDGIRNAEDTDRGAIYGDPDGGLSFLLQALGFPLECCWYCHVRVEQKFFLTNKNLFAVEPSGHTSAGCRAKFG